MSLISTVAQAQGITWEQPYRGDDPSVLYLPDTKAVYWRYGWKRKPGDATGIVINGDIPNVRYFSYNVYDDEIKASVGSFTDFQISPADGHNNPFAGQGDGASSSYKIYILPEGTKNSFKNVLYFPDRLTKLSVFLRHYVPQDGIQGGASLPKIEQYDPITMKPAAASASNKIPALSNQEVQKYLIPMLNNIVEKFERNPEAVIEELKSKRTGKPVDIKELIASQVVAKSFKFFQPGEQHHSLRFQTAGTYPNKDNYYLGLPIIREKGQALLARFKAPRIASSFAEYASADVRYFSLSQGDEHSYTHSTIMDVDMQIDAEGYANFIIADETPEMLAKAKALNVNFMPWQSGQKMLLIYRHMLPGTNFENGIDKVAVFDSSKPVSEQFAIKTIGSYALVGQLINSEDIFAMSKFPTF